MLNGVIIGGGDDAHTRSGPSPGTAALAPVANRVLLSRAIEALRLAGADEITVVASRDAAPSLRSGVAMDGAAVHWLPSSGACDAGSALLAAADAVGGDRFIVHTTDGLWLRRPASALGPLACTDHDALLFLRPVGELLSAGWGVGAGLAGTDTQCRPAPDQVCGLLGFSRAILDPLRDTDPGSGDRRLYDAVDALAAAGGRVKATNGDGWWTYTGLPDELLEANRIVLDGIEASVSPELAAENRIEGRVFIDPDVEITGSFIRGPVVIGAHATISDAYIGPYTSIGEAVTVDNAEIESSIVLTGARIRHVGSRLESSIIGAGASVGRAFDQPRACRLVIGDDARVTFA